MKNETEININDERAVRLKKLLALREMGLDTYPAKVEEKIDISLALDSSENEEVAIAGRIMSKREMGKLTFAHLQDKTGIIQLVFKQDVLEKEDYKILVKKIDIADIIYARGKKFITQKGEQSVLVDKWVLLTKSLLPLPDKFHGLAQEEKRLRKRYLDLLLNSELKDVFVKKSIFWQSVRNFLLSEGFFEVETPVLEVTAGGADATPFITHHNALDLDVYLRISMGELWQKRLMVAGFEKTFEIGRQFRNEGMSREHLQDYTQMEFYWAYADYEKGMKLAQKMYQTVLEKTFGTLSYNIKGFKNIDMGGEWPRIDYVETIKEVVGLDVLTSNDNEIRDKLTEMKVKYDDNDSKARLVDSLWKVVRKQIRGPVFLINHPVFISPLAKRKDDNPNLTERFQIIIAGSEIGNGYSELNDPIDQSERFKEQAKMREAGDFEAQMHDKDFVEALEHGMPPTCGFGFSERLFSFFADRPIRECVLFPLLKPEGSENDKV